MSYANGDGIHVYTGAWTDWTYGHVRGLTLTLPLGGSAVLIAFLAIFVKLVGGSVWDIFCYTLFHFRSTVAPRDGLFHQQQALLRNNLSDSRAVWQFASIAWYWRGKTRRPVSRTLSLLLAAVLHFVAFSVAGIFSAKVAYTGANVLTSGPACGNWDNAYERAKFNNSIFAEVSEQVSWFGTRYRTAAAYASSCYNFNSPKQEQSRSNCQAYGRQQIPWSIDAEVFCPFAYGICIGDMGVIIDSGYIDSHQHLGINGPPDERVIFRTVRRISVSFDRCLLTVFRTYTAVL